MIKKFIPFILIFLLIYPTETSSLNKNHKHIAATAFFCLVSSILLYKIGQFFNPWCIIQQGDNYIVYKNNFWGNMRASIGSGHCCATPQYIVRSNGSIKISNNEIFINNVRIDLCSPYAQQCIRDEGVTETKTIDIPSITSFDISNIGQLIVKQNSIAKEELVITADKNILPHLKTDISRNMLYLGTKNYPTFTTNTPVIFCATVRNINSIKASNDATVKAASIVTNQLELHASNDAKITAKVTTTILNTTCENDAKVDLSGKATTHNITLLNDARCNAAQLDTNKTIIQGTNDAKATIKVKDTLQYKLLNDSHVHYTGNPTLKGTRKNSSSIKSTL